MQIFDVEDEPKFLGDQERPIGQSQAGRCFDQGVVYPSKHHRGHKPTKHQTNGQAATADNEEVADCVADTETLVGCRSIDGQCEGHERDGVVKQAFAFDQNR